MPQFYGQVPRNLSLLPGQFVRVNLAGDGFEVATPFTGVSGSSATATDLGALSTGSFSGLTKITVGTAQPGTPNIGDLWIDSS